MQGDKIFLLTCYSVLENIYDFTGKQFNVDASANTSGKFSGKGTVQHSDQSFLESSMPSGMPPVDMNVSGSGMPVSWLGVRRVLQRLGIIHV